MKPLSAADLILASYLQQDLLLLNGDSKGFEIIPPWFQQKNPTLPFPEKMPVYAGPDDTPELLARVNDWLADACYDLPDSEFFTDAQNWALEAYQAQIQEWTQKKYEWVISQNLIQLRKWIYWVTRFSWMDITDGVAMEMAGLPSTVGDHIADRQ